MKMSRRKSWIAKEELVGVRWMAEDLDDVHSVVVVVVVVDWP